MTQLTDDCFAFGGALLPLADAQARIAARFSCVVGEQRVALAGAVGRVLARDVMAGMDLPGEANSAVDGYAVHFADLAWDGPTILPVLGRVSAGHPAVDPLPRGFACRIFTGGVMPAGSDTVMMQEDCVVLADGVRLQPGISRGANCRLAGEDVPEGAIALRAGRRLTPVDIGLLAALGQARVVVRQRLVVALFSTGDEIADPPARLRAGQVYDANRFMLAALLRRLGAEVIDGGILPDDADETAQALAEVGADLVVTSGGVSTGEEDHVRAAIAAAGTLEFWRVAIKPGRPVALGQVGGSPLLGLPGNPVAALVTMMALGQPLLDRLAGAAYVQPLRLPVEAAFAYQKKLGRREYVRVQIVDGVARRYPKEGAGIITSLTESDALMELPEAMTLLSPGDFAPCIPLGLLYG